MTKRGRIANRCCNGSEHFRVRLPWHARSNVNNAEWL